MNILFISDNFPPEVNAPASRTHEHCREWVARGHRVTVITCAPNFPQGEVFAGYRNRLWQRETIDGIEVVRVWSYIAANTGFAKRILDYVSFAVTSFIASLFVRRCDVVIATSPQFFAAFSGWMVGAVKRIAFVFELRDLWPESIKAVGVMSQSRLIDALERLELFLYRRATLIVSVTHAFKANLASRGIDPAKILIITNGVDTERFSYAPKHAELERELGFQNRFVAGYIGTHGMAHALETVLEAADAIRYRPGGEVFRFLFLGDGAEKTKLKAKAASLGLDNVLFVDTVPKADVAKYWSLLDTSIIHLKREDLFSSVIPSKLFECMGMGIPVLHGVQGESALIVESEGIGITFEPQNAGALVELLERLRREQALLESLRGRCLAAAPNYDRRRLAGEMIEAIERLVTTGGGGRER